MGGDCPGIIELPELDTAAFVSNDPGLVWWRTYSGPTPLFRIGVYEAPSWKSRQIGEYGGWYSIVAMCPDGRCVFLKDDDSALRYRLDLDGMLTVVPYQEIIGTFSVP